MARTRRISDERILEAAREMFIERGVNATTLEIAQSAGVSEGTIFKRFGTKQDLFVAAMVSGRKLDWAALVEKPFHDPEEALSTLFREVIAFFRRLIPATVMMMSTGVSPVKLFETHGELPPVAALRAMTTFFCRGQDAGFVSKGTAPEILARLSLGALHHYAFCETQGINEQMPMSQERYISGLVRLVMVRGPVGEVVGEVVGGGVGEVVGESDDVSTDP